MVYPLDILESRLLEEPTSTAILLEEQMSQGRRFTCPGMLKTHYFLSTFFVCKNCARNLLSFFVNYESFTYTFSLVYTFSLQLYFLFKIYKWVLHSNS